MHAAARGQRGVALLVVLVALGLLVGMLAIGFAGDLVRQNQSQQRTTDALAQAREALIGWSVQRTSSVLLPNARPGELPCPDINPLDGFEDGSCAAGAIGRVPWKTLGIPEPKDDAGETLWYAVAGPFRIWSLNGTVINSDARGDLTVYQDSTASAITTKAVAVLFTAGAALGTQNRDPVATALCPTTGTSIALNLCAANYLETATTVNNATTNGPYISAQRSDTFNDRLLVITNAELMPVVEQRVAREILTLLQSYRAASACACYPWAAINFDDDSVAGTTRGGVPIQDALPEVWGAAPIPSVPGWITNNNWGMVFYYAVAPAETATPTAGTLTVDVVSKNVVLITPGPAGASRPSTNLPDYLDDAENSNNNDIFVTPSSTAYARDRIYVIP
ncbi:MAG: hypothetical protein ACREVT_14910 [Burkholderiales bacterium]